MPEPIHIPGWIPSPGATAFDLTITPEIAAQIVALTDIAARLATVEAVVTGLKLGATADDLDYELLQRMEQRIAKLESLPASQPETPAAGAASEEAIHANTDLYYKGRADREREIMAGIVAELRSERDQLARERERLHVDTVQAIQRADRLAAELAKVTEDRDDLREKQLIARANAAATESQLRGELAKTQQAVDNYKCGQAEERSLRADDVFRLAAEKARADRLASAIQEEIEYLEAVQAGPTPWDGRERSHRVCASLRRLRAALKPPADHKPAGPTQEVANHA